MYFPPYQHPTLGYCADGGVFANNPSTAALARALATGNPLGNITMLSLGTGNTANALEISSPLCAGINKWLWPFASGSAPAFPLLNVMLDAVAALAENECTQILGPNNYLRVNLSVPQTIDMDDYEAVPLMEKLVADYMATPDWTKVKNWVNQHFNGNQRGSGS